MSTHFKKDNSTGNLGVLAIRIYFAEDRSGCVPMADLLMSDYVVETIEWTNVKQRKEFESGINGYTLIYDERPKRSWKDWLHRDQDDND